MNGNTNQNYQNPSRVFTQQHIHYPVDRPKSEHINTNNLYSNYGGLNLQKNAYFRQQTSNNGQGFPQIVQKSNPLHQVPYASNKIPLTNDPQSMLKLKSRNRQVDDKSYKYTTKRTFDDNQSVNSKNSIYSTKSIKQKYLRGVSINNPDHFQSLVKKEYDYKTQNSKLIENFIHSLNVSGQKIRDSLCQKVDKRIAEIWLSYYQEQQRKPDFRNVDSQINQGIQKINDCFKQKLSIKSENYHLNLKKAIFESIFKTIEQDRNKKVYLDEELEYLMNNQYIETEKQYNIEYNKTQNQQNNYMKEVREAENKMKLANQEQQDAYHTEMDFQVIQDSHALKQILMNGETYLRQKLAKINYELSDYNRKQNDYDQLQSLENEIQSLRRQQYKFFQIYFQ